jgi:YD repeat-containing protein
MLAGRRVLACLGCYLIGLGLSPVAALGEGSSAERPPSTSTEGVGALSSLESSLIAEAERSQKQEEGDDPEVQRASESPYLPGPSSEVPAAKEAEAFKSEGSGSSGSRVASSGSEEELLEGVRLFGLDDRAEKTSGALPEGGPPSGTSGNGSGASEATGRPEATGPEAVPVSLSSPSAPPPAPLLLESSPFSGSAALSPAQENVDTQSRMAYTGLGREAAVALAERTFHIEQPVWTAPGSEPGSHITRYLSANTASEERSGGKRVLVQSTLPLQVDNGSGEKAPVSATLHEAGGAYVPANPLVPLSISKEVRSGASFLSTGIKVAPASDAGEAPVMVGNRVMWANTASDTDFISEPMPGGMGVEDSWQLRSQQSPSENALVFNLPPDASLQTSSTVPGGAEVVMEGKSLLLIPPASAHGADGRALPVAYSVNGDTLTTRVNLSGNVDFPAMVDPEVIGWYGEANSDNEWRNWHNYSECGYGPLELSSLIQTGTNPGGSVGCLGEWYTGVPSSNSAGITRVDVSNVIHQPANQSFLSIGITESNGSEIWTSNGYAGAMGTAPLATTSEYYDTPMAFCADGAGGHDGGEQPLCNENYMGKEFYFADELWEEPQTVYNYARISAATIRYVQTTPPTLSNESYIKSGWTSASPYIVVKGEDSGIGASSIGLDAVSGIVSPEDMPSPGSSPAPGTSAYSPSCDDPFCYASLSDEYSTSVGTGVWTLGAWVKDAVGLQDEQTYNAYIDKSPPTIPTPKWNKETLGDGSHELQFSAEDGSVSAPRSGVELMEVYIDGKYLERVKQEEKTCPKPEGSNIIQKEGCYGLAGKLTLQAEDYGAGPHTITIYAQNWADLWEEQSFTITIAHPVGDTQQVGPGTLNLRSGDYTLGATDVSLPSGTATLSVARTYNSQSQEPAGPLGPGWLLSLPDTSGGGQWQSLQVLEGSNVEVTTTGGQKFVFIKSGEKYISPADFKTYTLSEPVKSPATYRITDPGGDYTQFTEPSGATAFMPATVGQAAEKGGLNKVTYVLKEGKTTEILGPEPSGASCSTTAPEEWTKERKIEEEHRGCRALSLKYDIGESTAKGEGPTEWGNVKGQLENVSFTAWNPKEEKIVTISVARYEYDKLGRLRAEWDPRIEPELKTIYGYDSENHVTAITPPGQESWIFTYGKIAGDASTGRLLKVTQAPASNKCEKGCSITAPVNTAAPRLSGAPAVGRRMAVSIGAWSNEHEPVSYGFQWEDCNTSGQECTPILGATNANYTPVSGDVGHVLVARVTATNGGGSVAISSYASAVVASTASGAPPSLTQTIDGGNSLNAVSCIPNTTDCVISDGKGNALYATNVSTTSGATWNAWSGPGGESPSQAVDCPTSSLCLLADGKEATGGKLYYATSLGGTFSEAYSPTYGVDAISCASSYFCVDGQDGEGYFRYSTNPASASWELEDQGSANMKGVSCLSSSFCVIADSAGSVHIATSTSQIESSSWTSTDVDGSSALNGVACTSTTSCVAVDGTGNLLNLKAESNGSVTASKHDIDGANDLTAVTCTGSSTCAAVDSQGNVFTSTNGGETWARQYVLGGKLTSVSCASSTLCVTVDTTGYVTAFGVSFAQPIDSGNSLNAVSCIPGTTDCVVSDSKGNTFYATNVSATSGATWNAWSGPSGESPSQAVDCPTSSLCLLADGKEATGGKLYYATSLGGTFSEAYSPTYGVDAISCASSSFCVDGQDNYGYFRYSTNPASTSWTLEEQGEARIKGVFCLSTSFCALAASTGWVHIATSTTQIESSKWTESDVLQLGSLNGIACTSTTSCIAIDNLGDVINLTVESNGDVHATRNEIDSSNELTSVTCTTSSTCVTVDNVGNVFVSKNGGESWTKEYTLGDKLTSVSCASPSLCATVDTSGNVTAFNPAGWPIVEGEQQAPQPGYTIEYNVPFSGKDLPMMSKEAVEKWGEKDNPEDATAVFPPDESEGWPAGDYRRATVSYFDSVGRLVNVVTPGEGISTTQYEAYGNPEWTLTPGNQKRAMESSEPAKKAEFLETKSTYEAEGTELESRLGPQHEVKLASGTVVQARAKTRYYYEEGAPTGGPYRLVTKTTEGALLESGKEEEERTIKTSYSGQSNLGWELHKPTSVTVEPENGKTLTRTTEYNAETGDVTNTKAPAANTFASEYPPVFSTDFGTAGSGNGQFKEPKDVAVAKNGNLLVLDTANSRVQELSSSGKYETKFGSSGAGIGQMKEPDAIAVDAKGNAWIADTGNNRIDEFNEKHEFVQAFGYGVSNGEEKLEICTSTCEAGTAGANSGQLKEPKGIAVTSGGDVYVSDTANNRIEEFGEKGEFVSTFGFGVSNGKTEFEICTKECKAGSTGSGNGQFDQPVGLAVDSSGNVWVIDRLNNRVEEFNSKNEYVSKFGTSGSGAGQLKEPKGIAVDSTGNVWIADTANNRVQKFSKSGSFVAALGGKGTGSGEFEEPWGIAFTISGSMYIADVKNSRVDEWVPQNMSAHESHTIYYTAGVNSDETCGKHPEWVNLPCQTQPATQPQTGGLPSLPVTTITYNMWGETETTSEKNGSFTRTTTQTYDPAGRLKETSVTSSTGKSVPTVVDTYSTKTGALVAQSTTSEGKTEEIISEDNTLGELTSYTDASKVTSTYTYDEDGRVTKVNDGKGTRTYEYNTTTGKLTTLNDSGAGTFTATYNPEGQLETETYPNGMKATYTTNSVGQTTGLTYTKGSSTWYEDHAMLSIHGQWLSQLSTLSNDHYTYDNVGRMTQVQEEAVGKVQEEAVGKGCITHLYAYDAESDRTSETKREPSTGGACANEGGTTTAHDYDEADRLIDPGVSYETFGASTTVPAADAGGHALESSYYANGALYSQTQNELTNTYALDPAGRAIESTATKGTSAKTTISNYAGSDSTPSWTELEGSYTRNIAGISGALAATQTSGDEAVIRLVNLHGDVIGTTADNSAAESATLKSEPTAFGAPTSTSTEKYGWLGGSGLQTEFAETGIESGSGGAYVPQLGLHLTPEALAGSMAQDPVNEYQADQTFAQPTGERLSTAPGAIEPLPVNTQKEKEFWEHPPWDKPPMNEGEAVGGDPVHCQLTAKNPTFHGQEMTIRAGYLCTGGGAAITNAIVEVCSYEWEDIIEEWEPYECHSTTFHNTSSAGGKFTTKCRPGGLYSTVIYAYFWGGGPGIWEDDPAIDNSESVECPRTKS